ncbi:MAG: histidinol-phosphate transaminase [Lachnospiraceae bacterium]|nr:histidinol-phosphate transaminase [Lachnospiraceae bacterium]
MREWEKNIRRVVPYVAGEQPNKKNMVKLNTNECPYPPTPKLEEALASMDLDRARLYPDLDAKILVKAIADFYNVDEEQVFVGVGSDDVLANVFLTFFNSDKPILFPDITYSFYPVWSDVYGIKYKTKPVDKDFRLVKEDYYEENGGIIFPNPNAPTGIYEELDFVEDIVKNNQKSVVVVDEAYIDFGGKSALELVPKYENLLVVQTFSKSRSTAGLRIGFAIGSKDLIQAMKDVKFSINSYTMNMPSITGGAAVVADKDYFDKIRNMIIETRENTKSELTKRGFTFPNSMANFIFATHKDYDITDMFKYLREKDVYVRHWDAENIKDYLRITIGTDEEMKKFLEVVDEYMEANK